MFRSAVKTAFYYITGKVLFLSCVKLCVGGFNMSVRPFFNILGKAHKYFFFL